MFAILTFLRRILTTNWENICKSAWILLKIETTIYKYLLFYGQEQIVPYASAKLAKKNCVPYLCLTMSRGAGPRSWCVPSFFSKKKNIIIKNLLNTVLAESKFWALYDDVSCCTCCILLSGQKNPSTMRVWGGQYLLFYGEYLLFYGEYLLFYGEYLLFYGEYLLFYGEYLQEK